SAHGDGSGQAGAAHRHYALRRRLMDGLQFTPSGRFDHNRRGGSNHLTSPPAPLLIPVSRGREEKETLSLPSPSGRGAGGEVGLGAKEPFSCLTLFLIP